MTTEKVRAVMDLYQMVIDAHEEQLTIARQNVASILRELLTPILNRWGMGMRKGGALLYLNPNMEGEDVVEVDKGCDYLLGELHPELAGALWEEVGSNGSTLHEYIEYIDIPTDDLDDDGVEYVWLVSWGGHFLEPLGFSESLTLGTGDTNDYSTNTIYYGPITQAFIDDTGIGAIDHDPHPYLDVLPKYTLHEGGKWVRVYYRPGSARRFPGLLLKGEVSDAINEPLSDGDLHQWGQTATE